MDSKAFLKAIDTLKLYRRAELVDDDGKKLIEELYVDPLPADHVLTTILHNNTTFLIGRKGTGKSTIFQRAQESLNKRSDITWAYIDIKTLFESSKSEILGTSALEGAHSLDHQTIERLRVFQNFSKDLVKEIKNQIDTRLSNSTWAKFKSTITGSTTELFEKLDEFIEELNAQEFT